MQHTRPTIQSSLVERVDSTGKGVGAPADDVKLTEVARLRWNLLREDVSLPAAVLYEDIVEHNLQWMRRFVDAYHVSLAPHGKTTMCPAIFRWQIEHGAWGITLATASQMRAAARGGVKRVLMANQLVGRRNMAIVSELMAADPAFEAYVLVDSADGVEQLGRFFSEHGQRIPVLLELGADGGRTGVRDVLAEQAVVAAVDEWKAGVVLAGIEVYEGVLPDETAIRGLLRRAVATVERLSEEGRFESGRSVILSGAGSAWFDVVAEELVKANIMQRLEIVLRPGCYVTHDIGAYTDAQNRMLRESETVRRLGEGLLPAMHVWAYVQSRPEPGLAIIGLGKRDAAFDAGLPKPALHYRPAANVGGGAAAATAPAKAPSSWTMTKIMDQHAYLSVPADADVRVGDMIAFDIYHPCLTWDKWRQVLVVNKIFDVTELLQTYF